MKLPSIALRLALVLGLFGMSSVVRAADADSEPEAPPKPRDLGPPLVDNVKDLKPLGKYAAWLDPKNKQVVLVGEAVKAGYGLEFLITLKDRGYESVLVVDPRRHDRKDAPYFQQIQTALILCGAKPGHPSWFDQKTSKAYPAEGSEISIEVRWKNKEGKTEHTDVRNWIRNTETKKPLDKNWVFGGSRIVDDGQGGKMFLAEGGGEFVCVANNPAAMLELPGISTRSLDDRIFAANADAMPPPETPVTIILKPVVKPKTAAKAKTEAKPRAGGKADEKPSADPPSPATLPQPKTSFLPRTSASVVAIAGVVALFARMRASAAVKGVEN